MSTRRLVLASVVWGTFVGMFLVLSTSFWTPQAEIVDPGTIRALASIYLWGVGLTAGHYVGKYTQP